MLDTRPPGGTVSAADTLQIRLPNIEEVQSEGKVTLEANLEKLEVTFKAHILNIT